MPIRSLNSSVLRWPDRVTVDRAVRAWAAQQVKQRPEVLKLGYFGSYARGNWGVGSDIDLVIVVTAAAEPFEQRTLSWDTSSLPVPAEILIYTESEWRTLGTERTRFARTLVEQTKWVYQR